MTADDQPGAVAVQREHLLTAALNTHIDRIESHRITLQPNQRSGAHIHFGGVVGYVVEGEIAFCIDGQVQVALGAGDVFFEPPGATIAHFDNASATQTATFVAFYPLTGDQALIVVAEDA